VASAKSLWDRYVVPGDLQAVLRYVWLTACREVHAYEGFCEDLARQIAVARLFQRQLGFRCCHTWVSVWSRMGFSQRRGVLKATI
jgi:hypothetical protein